MQVKSILRTSSITALNKKSTLKPQRTSKLKLDQHKENESSAAKHPALRFIRASTPSPAELRKFATLFYKGLFYAVNNLKGPSQQYLNKKKVKLPEPIDSKKKFLIMDLDETLIHSVFNSDKTDVKLTHKSDEFRFNIRPYCLEFLANMSQYYSIYVFTAGTQDYAQPIVSYLNQKKKTIQGVLHRKNCMETQNGFFIKDLRIISNRELKDIVIVDNLVHSFGLQIQNGIPILQFLDNKQDKELQGIEKMLIEMSDCEDVRAYLEDKLKLTKCLQIEESQFIAVDQNTNLKG